MSKRSEAPLSLSDCLCQICMEIFVEPVTLPCNHTLCNSCFQLTVEKASLCCPFCRRRVSSWARYNARRNTLINWELWEKIQKSYPEECERRINGQDLEEEISVPHPQHQLSKPGELRQEYEAEISKVEAERRAHEQEENKASEEYIQRLLAEEEEEQHRLAEERRREMEEQLKQDEELAWQLSNSLNESSQGHELRSPSPAGRLSSEASPANSCKVKNKPNNPGDIQKYLSPKLHHTLGSASFSRTTERGRRDSGSVETSSKEGNSSAWQDEQEEMPTLSPQQTGVIKDSSAKDSFLESCMNYLSASASGETVAVKQENTPGPDGLGDDEVPDALHGIAKGSRTVLRRSKGEDDGTETDSANSTHVESIKLENSAETCTHVQSATNAVVSDRASVVCDLRRVAGHSDGETPEEPQNSKETPKRKLLEPPAEAVVDLCVLDKRRRTFPESSEDQGEQLNDFDMQMHKALEQEFYKRRMQEEQDRLLALQLQKQINKEERTLNRQKGSPDEYLLRTKPPQFGKDSPARKGNSKMAKESKVPKNQAETNHRKTRRGPGNENWQSPTRVRMKSPSIKGGKVLNCVVNTSDSNDLCSLPKNKQKTILQMFKSSVAE